MVLVENNIDNFVFGNYYCYFLLIITLPAWIKQTISSLFGIYMATNTTSIIIHLSLARPQAPVIIVPSLMVDPTRPEIPMSCQGFVGKPIGTLEWQIKLQSESVYMEFNTTNESEVIETQCDVFLVSYLIFSPTSNMNGAHIRCVVTNDIVPNSSVLISEIQIHVLEGNKLPCNRVRIPCRCIPTETP